MADFRRIAFPDTFRARNFLRSKTARGLAAACALCIVLAGALLLIANLTVLSLGRRVYHSAEEIPERHVGLLLGTNPRTGNFPNLYFTARIEAAALLYKKGKVRKLIVSGDNGRREYDEATAMRSALIEKGVRPGDIYPDYAGFRTLDSVVRAKKVFRITSLTIISQEFHCRRALFIAAGHRMDAVGFAAADPGAVWPSYRLKMELREVLARTLAWLDVKILHRSPRFLGEEIVIPDEADVS